MATSNFPSQGQGNGNRGTTDPSTKPVENWLFMGNPGVGKSTLINCLVGEPVFKAGLSYGSGLTTFLQREQRDRIVYMDTPGLADTRLRQQAAEAITTALKQGDGLYKIFFVVTLQQARVKPDDVATVNKVLESVDVPDIKFSVIVNQVGKKQFRDMQQLGEKYQLVMQSLCAGRFQTPFVFFAPRLDELDEEENAVIPVPPDLRAFLENTAPTLHIPAAKVKEIDTNAAHFEADIARLEDLVSQLMLDKAKQQDEWKAFHQLHQQQLQDAHDAQQRLVERMMEQQLRSEEDRREANRLAEDRNLRMMEMYMKQSERLAEATVRAARPPSPKKEKDDDGCSIL